MKPQFREIQADQQSEIDTISVLAKSILHEFYGPQMPTYHIDFFIDKYQSKDAIKEQLNNSWKYFIIEINTIPIGYMGVDIQKDTMILSKLYVLSNQRNMGVGQLAIESVSQLIKEYNIKLLELHVNQMNDRAIRFYKKHGFTVVDELTTSYESGHTEHDYIMTKKV